MMRTNLPAPALPTSVDSAQNTRGRYRIPFPKPAIRGQRYTGPRPDYELKNIISRHPFSLNKKNMSSRNAFTRAKSYCKKGGLELWVYQYS